MSSRTLIPKPNDTSWMSRCTYKISLMQVDKATISDSVVDKAVSVCSFEHQDIGDFPNKITYPVQDFEEIGSICSSYLCIPQKSAST